MQKTKEIFDSWNKEKQFIELHKKKKKIVKIGEIWISKVGINIGSEISKDGNFTRPVLVISNFLGGDLVGVIPFTTQFNKNYSKFLLRFDGHEQYGLDKVSYLVLNQFKIISIKRLTRLLNSTKSRNKKVPNDIILDIKTKLINFI